MGSDETRVREFALRYGLLGRAWLIEGDGFSERRAEGEPLEWIRAHARAADLILRGVEVLRSPDREAAAREFLRAITPEIMPPDDSGDYGWEVVGLPGAPTAPIGVGAKWVQAWWDWSGPRPAAARVAVIVADIINRNLKGVGLRSFVKSGSHVAWRLTVRSLLDAAYWMLLHAAEEGGVRRCDYCQAYFITTHGRQRFCPRSAGEEGESLCALRSRWKRHKDRSAR